MGMKYVAAYLMAALAGKDSPSADDIKKILESVESEYDESIASKLVSELDGKTVHEVVAEGKEKLKGFGGGGGGGPAIGGGGGAAAPAAEAKKEEKKVEEEEEEEEEEEDQEADEQVHKPDATKTGQMAEPEEEAAEKQLAAKEEGNAETDREAEAREREAQEQEAKQREAQEREQREIKEREAQERELRELREREARERAEQAEQSSEQKARAQQESQEAKARETEGHRQHELEKRRTVGRASKVEEKTEAQALSSTSRRPSRPSVEAEAPSRNREQRASSAPGTSKAQPRSRAASGVSQRSSIAGPAIRQDPAALGGVSAMRSVDAAKSRRSTFRLGAQASPVSPYVIRAQPREKAQDEQKWLEDSESEELQFSPRDSSASAHEHEEVVPTRREAGEVEGHIPVQHPGPKAGLRERSDSRRTPSGITASRWHTEAQELGALRRSFLRSASASAPRARPCQEALEQNVGEAEHRLDLRFCDPIRGNLGKPQSRQRGSEPSQQDQIQQLQQQLHRQQLQIQEQQQQLQAQLRARTHQTPLHTPPGRRQTVQNSIKASTDPRRPLPTRGYAPSRLTNSVAGVGRGGSPDSSHASNGPIVPPNSGSRRLYRVLTRGLGVRAGPNVNAPRTGSVLHRGDIFEASVVAPGLDGRVYLKIAGWRGWAFDDSAVDPVDPTVEVLSEQEAFAVLSSAGKLSGSWSSQPSRPGQPGAQTSGWASNVVGSQVLPESALPGRTHEESQGADAWSTPTATVAELNQDINSGNVFDVASAAGPRRADPDKDFAREFREVWGSRDVPLGHGTLTAS